MTPRAAHAASFEAVRPRLFGIAYRTLERAADAEDVVQDAWIRWQGSDSSTLSSTPHRRAISQRSNSSSSPMSSRAPRPPSRHSAAGS